MNHVDLFSGLGGFALAAEWAGFKTILFCDNDPYCQAVLRKHWPDVPIVGDIRDVNEETVADAFNNGPCRAQGHEAEQGSYRQDDRLSIRGNSDRATTAELPTIDLLTGGFPCQPFSVAGKRGGTSDDRYLWPEMLRVISALKPTWVVAENVSGLTSLDGGMVFERVLSDLEGKGYEVQPFVIPACAVNAPHRRDRVWILAHVDDTKGGGCGLWESSNIRADTRDVNASCDTGEVCTREDVADTEGARLATCVMGQGQVEPRRGDSGRVEWWAVEPSVGRVAHGVPRRVDRLRCLGNAIVSQTVYPILRRIVEIEL